jgi:uncharacterized repeat protein (TIGR02543 family)
MKTRLLAALTVTATACAAMIATAITPPAQAAIKVTTPNVTCQSLQSFLNTGRNQNTGRKETSGTDSIWQVANYQQATTGNPVTIPPGAAAKYGDPSRIPDSKWGSATIGDVASGGVWARSPYSNANWIGKPAPIDGSYTFYRLKFTIDQDVALSTLQIPIEGTVDDTLQAIYVNGTRVNGIANPHFTSTKHIATLTGPWRVGQNEIIVSTWNIQPPSGLMISSPDTPVTCQTKNPAITTSITAQPSTPTDTYARGTETFTTTVTNTGNVDLTDITIEGSLDNHTRDRLQVPYFACPAHTLAPGASMQCTSTIEITDDLMGEDILYLGETTTATGAILGGKTKQVTDSDIAIVKPRYTLTYNANTAGGVVSGNPITRARGQNWNILSTARAAGKTFLGWYTTPTGGTQVTSSTTAMSDLTVYAHWQAKQFTVAFLPNAQGGQVTGTMPSQTFDVDCTTCTLPANAYQKTTGAKAFIDEDGGETTELNSVFLGWSTDPDARAAAIADRAQAGALSTGSPVTLYAIWDDAPQFLYKEFPNRYFTLDQARAGDITEAELLTTVRAFDRETHPLEHKTRADVTATGSDVGVTVFDYDPTDFTSMTAPGSVSVTYKLKDDAGSTAFMRIRVTVDSGDPLPSPEAGYYRAISSEYADTTPSQGGLADDSWWRTDPTRRTALTTALTAANATCYHLTADALTGIRNHIADSGFGNSEDPDALTHAATTWLTPTACQ